MKPNYKLSFIEEPKPLGTAGGLGLLVGKIEYEYDSKRTGFISFMCF